MATLPYVTAPGNIKKALDGIQSASTPERVNQDFVKTILQIPGGSGNQMTSFLKKIGFVNADGSPSDIYKQFRNTDISGRAVAKALELGYAPLYARNEYMYRLSDEKLKGLIIEETGQSEDSSVVSLSLAAIKALKKFACWEEAVVEEEQPSQPAKHNDIPPVIRPQSSEVGLNLSYTINLNLPATSDTAVFNAIFKSLKENLLKNSGNE